MEKFCIRAFLISSFVGADEDTELVKAIGDAISLKKVEPEAKTVLTRMLELDAQRSVVPKSGGRNLMLRRLRPPPDDDANDAAVTAPPPGTPPPGPPDAAADAPPGEPWAAAGTPPPGAAPPGPDDADAAADAPPLGGPYAAALLAPPLPGAPDDEGLPAEAEVDAALAAAAELHALGPLAEPADAADAAALEPGWWLGGLLPPGLLLAADVLDRRSG